MVDSRRDYSINRLSQLGGAMSPVLPLLDGEPLCVYATGSYGRLEAWSGSDIDLFFLYDGKSESARLPYTTLIRLSSCLIDATEQMGFPPFSGDGRYLEVLYVHRMESVLGSPEDDSINAFTARMLLLLESRPVHDAALYDQLLERIIGFYYRDFSDHPENFLPLFMLNDILRFWRTLTLNYEHDRLKLRSLAGEALKEHKAKSALKNYKLKASRLATCFSMVANLASEPEPVKPSTVLELCDLTPQERFKRLKTTGRHSGSITDELGALYEQFLDSVQHDDDELLTTFRDTSEKKALLDQASRYGELIYKLLADVVPTERMRYLVV